VASDAEVPEMALEHVASELRRVLEGAQHGRLQAWRHVQQAEAQAWGSAWQHSGLIFTREDGRQLHPDLVTDTFQRIAESAGLPPIRLHDLRHTAASLALQAGVPMKVVSEQLGHSSLSITADASVLPAVAHAAAEAVAGTVPRRSRKAQPASANAATARSLADRLQSGSQEGSMNAEPEGDEAKGLVRGVRRQGLEPRTR
jgi:hypothetical protein